MNKTWRAPQDTPSCCNSRRDYDDDDDNDSAAKTASTLSRRKAVSLPARWKAATTKKKKKASEAAAARWKADCFRSRPLKRNRYVWFQPSVGWLHSAFSSRWLVKIPLLRAHRTWIPLQLPVLFFSFPSPPPPLPGSSEPETLTGRRLLPFPEAPARHSATCFYSQTAEMWCMMRGGRGDVGQMRGGLNEWRRNSWRGER